jgi:hypothetical protein
MHDGNSRHLIERRRVLGAGRANHQVSSSNHYQIGMANVESLPGTRDNANGHKGLLPDSGLDFFRSEHDFCSLAMAFY